MSDLMAIAIASVVLSGFYLLATLTGRLWGDDGGAINDDWCSCPKCRGRQR